LIWRIRKMPNFAIGIVFKGVLHIDADTEEEARQLALNDEEAHGMIVGKAEPLIDWIEVDNA
jgi:hypothetical protein